MVQEHEVGPTAILLRKTNYVLAYDAAGNLVQVVETDVDTTKTRTSVLSYDSGGNLVGVTQT